MDVKDLDGNTSKWKLIGYANNRTKKNKSGLHLRARQLLRNKYPYTRILEEIPVKVKKRKKLYLDFYIPLYKLCIEVQGQQHFKFVSFYHNSVLDFIEQKKRDKQKEEWCKLNSIQIVYFVYDETDKTWAKKLRPYR